MGNSASMDNETNAATGRTYRQAKGELGQIIALRLPPDADVYTSLEELARREEIASGIILSGLGSLKQITLRNVRLFPEEFPIKDRHRIFSPRAEPLELLALAGNFSQRDGDVHVHAHAMISSGLEDGRAYGGHLLKGCIVFSTVEIVVCTVEGMSLIREMDPQTRVLELFFSPPAPR